MELIYLAFALFILGVSATIVYDKMKANGKSLKDFLPRVNQGDEELKAFSKSRKTTSSTKKSTSSQASSMASTNERYFNELIKEAKSRQKLGQTSIQVQKGSRTETMTVQDLIKQLEQMKKNL